MKIIRGVMFEVDLGGGLPRAVMSATPIRFSIPGQRSSVHDMDGTTLLRRGCLSILFALSSSTKHVLELIVFANGSLRSSELYPLKSRILSRESGRFESIHTIYDDYYPARGFLKLRQMPFDLSPFPSMLGQGP